MGRRDRGLQFKSYLAATLIQIFSSLVFTNPGDLTTTSKRGRTKMNTNLIKLKQIYVYASHSIHTAKV